MSSVVERFLRYVKVDTQSSEFSQTVPSTLKQLDLCRMLADECRQLGLQNVSLSEHGVVLATVPASPDAFANLPAFALVAHVDTSPETSGSNVKPVLHPSYAGGDLVLPGDPSKVLRLDENPELTGLRGATIITSDGTTLLGADDKAGVAAIMATAEELMRRRGTITHGPVRLCFTCDEEIGHGVDHIDLASLNVTCAYTLDGGGVGQVDCETFSADLAIVTVNGVNIHPSIGKGRMVNAIRILGKLLAQLPSESLCPEMTDGRDGFLHPYKIEGGVATATAQILLRDFETSRLREYESLLTTLARKLETEHPKSSIEVRIIEQYRNMREGLHKEPRAVPKAAAAMKAAGVEPELSIIRGGTDGSRLTALGLPCPNLSTGEHNPHSPLEWTSDVELETAVRVLLELAAEWARP